MSAGREANGCFHQLSRVAQDSIRGAQLLILAVGRVLLHREHDHTAVQHFEHSALAGLELLKIKRVGLFCGRSTLDRRSFLDTIGRESLVETLQIELDAFLLVQRSEVVGLLDEKEGIELNLK